MSVSVDHPTFIGKLLNGVHVELAKHLFDIIYLVGRTPSGGGELPFGGAYHMVLNEKWS